MWARCLMSEEKRPLYRRPDEPTGDLSNSLLFLYGSVFLAVLTLLYWLSQAIHVAELQLIVAGAGLWGPMLYVGLKALTFTFAPLSAGPIQFASGILFGVIPGTFYSVLGEVIGGCISVIIARLFGRRLVKKFVGEAALERIDTFYARHTDDWQSLLAARLLLFSVYDFISYAVGLGNIRFSTYIFVSFFGGLLPTYFIVLIGSEASQNEDFLLLVYLATAALFVLYMLFRRHLSRLFNWLGSKF